MLRTVLLSGSAVLQVAAIVFAMRMAFSSARKTAWVLLSIALSIMLMSRMSLLALLHHSHAAELDPTLRAAQAVIISALFVAALYYIRTAFVDRERAEANLAIGRQRLDMAMNAAPIGLWYGDLPLTRFVWDKRVCEHFWLPPAKEVTLETFYARLHPDDREAVREAVRQAVDLAKPYDIEYRTVAPDNPNQLKWIRAIGRVSFEDNKPALQRRHPRCHGSEVGRDRARTTAR